MSASGKPPDHPGETASAQPLSGGRNELAVANTLDGEQTVGNLPNILPRPPHGNHLEARVRLSIENLINTDWRETQFFFTSRLPGEPAGDVPDIHFTPGTPRSFLGGLAVHL